MATFVTTQNVTIWDLSIKLYGNTSNAVRLVQDNPILDNVTKLIPPGTEITFTAPSGNTVVDYFNKKNIVPTTGEDDPLQGSAFTDGFEINGFY